jgi:hypothetical protein
MLCLNSHAPRGSSDEAPLRCPITDRSGWNRIVFQQDVLQRRIPVTRRVFRNRELPDLPCYPTDCADHVGNSGVKLWLAFSTGKFSHTAATIMIAIAKLSP